MKMSDWSFRIVLALLPFLAVSPWQTVIRPPFYFGFFYFTLVIFTLLLLAFEAVTGKRKLRSHPAFILLSAFFIIYGVSLAVNWRHIVLDPNLHGLSGLMNPKTYNIFAYVYLLLNLMTAWLAYQMMDSLEKIKKALLVVAVSGSIAAFYGIGTIVLFMLGLIKELVFAPHIVPRLYGTATEPQVFADFMILTVPASLALMAEKKDRFSGLMVFLMLLAAIMTFSMGGWAGMAVAILAFVVFGLRRLPAAFYLKSCAVALLIVVSLLSIRAFLCPNYLFAFSSYFSKYKVWNLPKELKDYRQADPDKGRGVYNGTYAEKVDDKITRFFMAQTAMNMIERHPLLGVGIADYGFLYNEYLSADSPIKTFYEKPHNIYYEIMAESGVPNFLIFAAVALLALARALNQLFRRPDLYRAAILAGFAGLLVHGLSFGVMSHDHTFIALGLLLASGEDIS